MDQDERQRDRATAASLIRGQRDALLRMWQIAADGVGGAAEAGQLRDQMADTLEGVAQAAEHQELLREAAERLAGVVSSRAQDFDAAARATLLDLTVPRLADWCALIAIEESRVLRLVAVRGPGERFAPLAEEIRDRYPVDLHRDTVLARLVRTGTPQLFADIDQQSIERSGLAAAAQRYLRLVGVTSFMALPLRGRSRVSGAMVLAMSGSGRRFRPTDLRVAEDLALQYELALDNTRLHHEVREAIREREQVISFISHDLKNPLAAVLLGTMMLQRNLREEDAPRQREKLVLIQRAAERMTRLINDLSDVGRLDAGRLELKLRTEDSGALIETAVAAARPMAAEQRVELAMQLSAALPRVACDRERVVQVLGNLITNAIAATPPGGEITVSAQADSTHVVFAVADTGAGIAAENLRQIFEPFWRGDERRYTGTGLGLAIARGLVELHGGRIWVESTPGLGSAFMFSLCIAHGN